jgi:hypothetical protein
MTSDLKKSSDSNDKDQYAPMLKWPKFVNNVDKVIKRYQQIKDLILDQ